MLNNTRPTHFKGENEDWHVTSTFYYQADQILSPNQIFWKSLWPRLTLYWCDARMNLCLNAFVMSWQTHEHCDNLRLIKTFNFGMYVGYFNLEWRIFLYTFYWKTFAPSNCYWKKFYHCKVFLNLYLLKFFLIVCLLLFSYYVDMKVLKLFAFICYRSRCYLLFLHIFTTKLGTSLGGLNWH